MSVHQKFSKLGLVTPGALIGRGVEPGIASILAGVANCGLSANTWKSYECIRNNLRKCENETKQSMELPFNGTKMLTFVGWMITRELKASSMSSYISALRMYHIALGFNEPVLREPIVKLILKGQSNWDMVRKKISGQVGRLPVSKKVLLLIKKMIQKQSLPQSEKLLVWAVSTVLWNGSFRVHEILGRVQREYDPQTTLLWEDVREREVVVDGSTVTALAFKIKSPKVDKVGTGDYVEVYWTGGFNCPVTAFQRWRRASRVEEQPKMPVFRLTQGCCYTGQQLNKRLEELTGELCSHVKGGKITSHSFRAGVASEMCKAGYSEQDILAAGRWGSDAYKSYCKLGSTYRANLVRTLVGST